MKICFLLMILVSIVSCGEDLSNQDLNRSLNTIKNIEADDYLSAKEKTLMSDFCAALNDKVVFFNSKYVGTAAKINVLTAKSSCIEKKELGDIPAEIKVKEVADKLYFDENAVFPVVITAESNELSGLCGLVNSDDDVQRHVVSNNEAKWFEVFDKKQPECQEGAIKNDDKTLCIKISTGVKDPSGEKYIIKKIDFMRTTIANTSSRGVIYHRRALDSRNCGVAEMEDTIQNILSDSL